MGRQKLRLEIRRAVGGRGGFHGRNKDESKGIIGRSTSRSDEEDDDGHHNNNEHGGDGNTNDTSSAPFIGDIDSIVTANGHNNESIILLSKLSPVKTAAISNIKMSSCLCLQLLILLAAIPCRGIELCRSISSSIVP